VKKTVTALDEMVLRKPRECIRLGERLLHSAKPLRWHIKNMASEPETAFIRKEKPGKKNWGEARDEKKRLRRKTSSITRELVYCNGKKIL